jgi:hypothetical protein
MKTTNKLFTCTLSLLMAGAVLFGVGATATFASHCT